MLGSLVFFMVPKAGLEPARRELRLILSQVRLPIPPLRHEICQQRDDTIIMSVCQACQCVLREWGQAFCTYVHTRIIAVFLTKNMGKDAYNESR